MKCQYCGTEFSGKFCPECGAPAPVESQQVNNTQYTGPAVNYQQPFEPATKTKKPVFKKWWFWVIIVVAVFIIIPHGKNGNASNNASNNASSTTKSTSTNNKVKVTVVDLSAMDKAAIQSWADTNKVTCQITEDYSDTVEKGAFVSQSVKTGDTVDEGSTIKVVFSLGKKPSTEYMNALEQAKSYSENMHMSKAAIYDQLTSQYGGKFPEDAAQYAMDNLQADFKDNALQQADSYSKTMYMSKKGIYDQLISENGGQFTEEETQYAIDNLQADFKANALKKAKSYQDQLKMSTSAIYDQLVSDYGEKFTEEEAQYAIDHLGD